MSSLTDLLLVGTGPMAVEYAKVLTAMKKKFTVVGRGETSAAAFQAATNIRPVTGGLAAWLRTKPALPKRAIVAVSENELGRATLLLLRAGMKSILVEKPGGFVPQDIRHVARVAKRMKARVYVGYNRRFYSSVAKAQEIIRQDGGVTSFSFEFTEWSHIISGLKKNPGVKEQWFLHNSTHVVDLAFFLGGWPKSMSSYAAGRLTWHPRAVFAGAGVAKNGALFSYQANWQAPGRWGVEIMTKKHRLILRPMEKLQIQQIGSVQITEVPFNDRLDTHFKPGLFRQTQAWLTEPGVLPTLNEQVEHLPIFKQFLTTDKKPYENS